MVKNRKDRYWAIADVRLELESIIAGPHDLKLQEARGLEWRPTWRHAVLFAITAAVLAATIAVIMTVAMTTSVDQFAIPLKNPITGETAALRNYLDIQAKLDAGWKVASADSTFTRTEKFQGGWLIDGLPINTVITGTIDPVQVAALRQASRWNWNGANWDTGPNAIRREYFENVADIIGMPQAKNAEFYRNLNSARVTYGTSPPPPPGPEVGATSSGRRFGE